MIHDGDSVSLVAVIAVQTGAGVKVTTFHQHFFPFIYNDQENHLGIDGMVLL